MKKTFVKIFSTKKAQDSSNDYVHKIALFSTDQNLHAEINDSLTSTLDQ